MAATASVVFNVNIKADVPQALLAVAAAAARKKTQSNFTANCSFRFSMMDRGAKLRDRKH